MSRVPIVVVGAGHLGNYHIQKLKADPLADLLGFVEPRTERREELGAKLGVKGEASLDAYAGKAHAAVIAAPTSLHLEVSLQALSVGMHILVEKPVCKTVAEGEKLLAAAKEAQRWVQVGHSERWNPAVRAAFAVADKPGYIAAERLGPFTGRSTEVDVILDLMIHDLDLVAALVPADLVEVRAVGVPVLTTEIDMASARLAFADGTIAQLSAGRASLEPVRKLRLFTRERYLSIDCAAKEVKCVRRLTPEPGSTWPQIVGEPIDVPAGDALANQDHDFLVAIAENRPPLVDGKAGLRALQLAESVTQAMTRPV